ncbi:peptidyl-prolyl cis-trans isomerase [bacterium]|nr:peptidyl-prolyl cis-trans isomerase [bacterium]
MSRPAWRFAALGALLFAAHAAWPRAAAPPPAAGDAEARLAAAARALGLDRDDAVVQRQLQRNGRFLGADDGAGLGLEDSDLVVQRRLANRLRLAIEAAARAEPPSDAELDAYLARHPEPFLVPARVQLTQVFLDRARGATLAADAAAWRATARAGGAPAGDPLPIALASSLSAADLERLLGAAVAAAAFALPLGEWSEPIASPYGLHLLRVEARTPARLPPLDEIRAAVAEALLAERAAGALAAAERELRGAP